MSDADSEALKSYRIPRDRQGRGVPAFSFFRHLNVTIHPKAISLSNSGLAPAYF
jgi:hypothetical protein